MLKAALSHFVAARDKTVANLNNLLQNPGGIGEHIDLVAEVIGLIEELERVSGCITLLNNLSTPAAPGPRPDEE